MKKRFSPSRLLLLAGFVLMAGYAAAQPPPPPPPPDDPPCWPPPCVPVDGGISIAIAAAAVLGGKKIYDAMKTSGN